MKSINRRVMGLLLPACILLSSGCNKAADEVTFSNAYDIYDTSKKYQLISAYDTSLNHAMPFFASGFCVADGSEPKESTSSYVAEAAGLFNLSSQKVLFSQNVYKKIYPASTTKILTAYIALKYGDLDSIATISENAVDQDSDSSICNLKAGDKISLRQLLYGLMMQSGNDAAVAIAEHISGDIASFAELMNQEANALGAMDSHFANPNGLHEDAHYTTVYDMYLIFRAAIQNEEFLDLIETKEYTADYLDAAGMPVQQVWKSTNKYLLGLETVPSGVTVIGGKTGTTNAAGYCLVLLTANKAGEQVISIVMKADSRNNLYYYMSELLYRFCNNLET